MTRSLFPPGTLLEPTFLNIATSRQGPGGPIALFYVFTVSRSAQLQVGLAQQHRRHRR